MDMRAVTDVLEECLAEAGRSLALANEIRAALGGVGGMPGGLWREQHELTFGRSVGR